MIPEQERAALEASLAAGGLDLGRWFSTRAWNRSAQPAERLADFGREGAAALVVGNTRALWDVFVAALRAAPALIDAARPLDEYVERCVTTALSPLTVRTSLRFAHEGPPYVPIQRLASEAGLAWLSPAHLSVHPVFGPWIALRAVVTFDATPPADYAAAAAVSPCAECARACAPALVEAQQRGSSRPPEAAASGAWLAVRDACPLGREHRYAADQISYHYGKDRELLRQLLSRDLPS